jgi:hypothetical protein
MTDAYVSGLAVLAGSAIGGFVPVAATWLTLNVREGARNVGQALPRNENLYGQVTEEASKVLADALNKNLDDASKLVHPYALLSKLRLFASLNVLSVANEVMQQVVAVYESPTKDFNAAITRARELDLLRPSSKTGRRDPFSSMGQERTRSGSEKFARLCGTSRVFLPGRPL